MTIFFILTACGGGGGGGGGGSSSASDNPASPTTTLPEVIQNSSVVATTPKANATQVALTDKITITVNKDLNQATLTSSTILLTDTEGNQYYGTIAYANKVISFTPGDGLIFGKTYQVRITTKVEDTQGMPLKEAYSWKFSTTAEEPIALIGADRRGITTKQIKAPTSQEIIFLNGSGSIGSQWAWTVVNTPQGATANLTSPKTQVTGFYADTVGSYTLRLQSSNSDGKSVSDSIIITLINDADLDGQEDTLDADRDGDGFLNANDKFPTDKSTHYDSDANGSGNYAQDDEDKDGTDDINDDFPFDATKKAYTVYTEKNETGKSNQNDGITIAENAGIIPLAISGYLTADNKRPDLDYFKFSIATTGRFSAVLTGSKAEMSPSLAILDKDGVSVEATTANLPALAGMGAISVSFSSTGTYYLSVTDSSGASDPTWKYAVSVFADNDLDGLSDDFEKAIDSNEFTADSDADGLPDYIEIQDALKNWSVNKDLDKDGLPNWWDLDADNDGVADGIEYYDTDEIKQRVISDIGIIINDIDEDGTPNYLDSDSDGNGVSDQGEAGSDPTHPLDSNQDGIPDYLSLDDDSDGLLDSNETNARTLPLVMTETILSGQSASAIPSISYLEDQVHKAKDLAQTTNQVILYGANLPTSSSQIWLVIQGAGGSINLRPTSSDGSKIQFTWPAGMDAGIMHLFVAINDKRTNALSIKNVDNSSPILTGYSVNTSQNRLTLNGKNLTGSFTVHLSGASVANVTGTSTAISVSIPATAERGPVQVSNAAEASNPLWVDLARALNGKIVPPKSSKVDLAKLDVSWDLLSGVDVNPDSSGNFSTSADFAEPSVVTAILATATSTTSDPTYATFLMGLALPNESSITVDSSSTALALTWGALNLNDLLTSGSASSAKSILTNLAEVKALATLLETKIGANSAYLNQPDSDFTTQTKITYLAAAQAVSKGVSLNNLRLNNSQRLARAANVSPGGKTDDFQVYEKSGTGNVTVVNDTQLYAGVEIKNLKGETLVGFPGTINDMVSPQGYGLLFWSNAQDFEHPKGQNSIVTVVNAGVPDHFSPHRKPPSSLWNRLVIRTLIERVVWPPISSTLSLKEISAAAVADIVMNNATNVYGILGKISDGDIKGGVSDLLTSLWQDIASVPPGPITGAIIQRVGKDIVTQKLKQLAAKTSAKLVPIAGQLLAGLEIAGHVNNGTGVAKAMYDMSVTDGMIEFKVDFPLQVDEVLPNKIILDGKSKKFLIKGAGFEEITRGIVFQTVLRPAITFTDSNGREFTAEPSLIKADGKSMTLTVDGSWLDKKDTKGPLKLVVHHPTDEPNATASLNPAVTIVENVEISSISPNKGSVKSLATIYGAGFSNIVSDNLVQVGSETALISQASETELKVVIPGALKAGKHDVKVKSRLDGVFSDWSNTVSYEVIEGEIKITVSDNGGDKDDAFALYVDGVYIGTMYANNNSYSKTYSLSLAEGKHNAILLGVEAPDSVGTYSISFSGVDNLSGDSGSGDDLVPGVRKYYTFSVSVSASGGSRRVSGFTQGQVADKESVLRKR